MNRLMSGARLAVFFILGVCLSFILLQRWRLRQAHEAVERITEHHDRIHRTILEASDDHFPTPAVPAAPANQFNPNRTPARPIVKAPDKSHSFRNFMDSLRKNLIESVLLVVGPRGTIYTLWCLWGLRLMKSPLRSPWRRAICVGFGRSAVSLILWIAIIIPLGNLGMNPANSAVNYLVFGLAAFILRVMEWSIAGASLRIHDQPRARGWVAGGVVLSFTLDAITLALFLGWLLFNVYTSNMPK